MSDKYTLVPDETKAFTAFGFVEIDGKSIPLPGRFSMIKPGLWANDATGVAVFWRGDNE